MAQAGPLLEVELLERAVRGSNSCYAAEAFGPGARGEVFTSADELYHIVLVIGPAAPVALYVNGARLTDLHVPLRPTPATYPITVDWRLWPDTASLLIAPRYARQAQLAAAGAPATTATDTATASATAAAAAASAASRGGWSGAVLLLAAYSAALTEVQVSANFDAWLD